eukprot:8126436-Alexandrium_andersonii.AAC.1
MSRTSDISPASPSTKRIPPRQHTARTLYVWAYPARAATKRHMSPFIMGAIVVPSQSSSSAQAK